MRVIVVLMMRVVLSWRSWMLGVNDGLGVCGILVF